MLYSALTGFRCRKLPRRAEAQVRYRSSVPVTVLPWATPVSTCFDEPQFSITAGQAAVWYDGDIVWVAALLAKTKRQKILHFCLFSS